MAGVKAASPKPKRHALNLLLGEELSSESADVVGVISWTSRPRWWPRPCGKKAPTVPASIISACLPFSSPISSKASIVR